MTPTTATSMLDPRRLLGWPLVYNLFQGIVGKGRGDAAFLREYVRARPGDRVLDIGCGPAHILERLPEVEYVGFDESPEYIDAARRRYGGRGTFSCSRVGEFRPEPPGSFDLAMAQGVLHHLDDAGAVRLLELARSALKPGGRLLTFDGVYVDGQSRAARFILSKDRGRFVRRKEEYERLARQVFDRVAAHVRGDLYFIPYTILVLECAA